MKRISIVLLSVMLLFTFSSCDKKANETVGTSKPTAVAATLAPKPTEIKSTPTLVPSPSPSPIPVSDEAIITVADSTDNFVPFGESTIVDAEAKVPYKSLRLIHEPDPDEDTLHDSGGYIEFISDKAGKADIIFTLACPDAINGASGYSLDWVMNKETDDPEYETLFLEDEKQSSLDILQEFTIQVDLKEGTNKLYVYQETTNNAGGWRIVIPKIMIRAYGSTISGYVASKPHEKVINDLTAAGLVLGADNADSLLGALAEECADAAAPGGKNIGYLDPDSKVCFVLNVKDEGTYIISYKVACSNTDTPSGMFSVCIDGEEEATFINDQATGGWQNWADAGDKTEITLKAGEHKLDFIVTEGGFNVMSFTLTRKA